MPGDTAVGIAFRGKDQVTPVVRGIRSTMDRFKRDAKAGFGLAAGFSVWGATTRAIGTVVDVFGDAVSAASDFAEANTKVGVVFGEEATAIRDFADAAASSLGLSERAALAATGTFGNLFDALGQSDQAASEMSRGLVRLAADLASFNNADIQEVMTALQSGLVGETEPMRRLGVSLSAARVESYLLASGIAESKDAITDAMKVSARYRIIMEDTKNAQGDFARTSDGLANTQRRLAAEMDDALVSLGETLLPLATEFASFAADTIPQIAAALGELGDAFNNVNRFLNPHLAIQQDLADEVYPALAEQYGLSAEALIRYSEAQDEVAEKARLQAAANQAQLAVIQHAVADGLQLALTNEQIASSVAALTGASEAEIAAILATNDGFEQQTRQIMTLTPVVREQTEAEKERAAAWGIGEQRAAELAATMAELKETEKNAIVVTGALGGGVKELTGTFADSARLADTWRERVIEGVIDIGPSLKETIKANKKAVREAMTDLRWAMEHPFAGDRYVSFLKRKQEAAQRKLHTAMVTGKVDAAADARAIVEAIGAELLKLDAFDYKFAGTFALKFATDALNVPGKQHGGPVSAGQTYLVGERGPELLTMGSTSGYVTPNQAIGGGDVVVNIDGHQLFRILDARMGKRYSLTGRGSYYRSAD